jgi:hypothetical protein
MHTRRRVLTFNLATSLKAKAERLQGKAIFEVPRVAAAAMKIDVV